jgi:hypothetical protein
LVPVDSKVYRCFKQQVATGPPEPAAVSDTEAADDANTTDTNAVVSTAVAAADTTTEAAVVNPAEAAAVTTTETAVAAGDTY